MNNDKSLLIKLIIFSLCFMLCVGLYNNSNNTEVDMITTEETDYDLIEASDYTNNNTERAIVVSETTIAITKNTEVSDSYECTTDTEYESEIDKQIKYYDTKSLIDTTEDLHLYSFEVPDQNTEFKAYMDYRCISDDTTEQWKLRQEAYTDEYGLRKVDDCYCVAVGSYYSDTIGDKFKITLENGNEFNIIVSDFKQDRHTDSKNQYTPVYDNYGNFYGANVLEFMIDKYIVDNMVLTLGTVSYYEQFEGNITKIEKIEERT